MQTLLPDMPLFVEVGRTGSFRQAAQRLGMPVSTLSRRISALEAKLGLQLFQRTTRSVALAPTARAYFEACVRVIEAADRAQHALASSKAGPGRLRIAMPVDLGVDVLGPLIADHAAAHPGLQVEMDLSSRAADLLRDPVDLALRIGRPLDERVVARRIAEVAAGLYASPSLLKRLGPVTEPETLVRLPCLNLLTSAGPMPWKVGHQRWPAAPGPHTLSANSVGLLRALAEQSHGIALLPRHIAAPGLKAGRLAQVLANEAVPAWPLYAITASRLVPGTVSALIAHVKRALQATPLVAGQPH